MNQEDVIIFDWEKVAYASRMLALNIAKDGRPYLVVGITRGGCCIATIISEMLRRNMITVCATRRKNDIEVNDKPILITKIDRELVKGKKILVVDEIAVTGETIEIQGVARTHDEGEFEPSVAYAKGVDVWDGTAATSFAGGTGTAEDPFLIENGGQLYKMVVDYSNAATGSGAENTKTYFKSNKYNFLKQPPIWRFLFYT